VIGEMFYITLILEIYIIVIYKIFMLELFAAFSLLVRVVSIVFIFIMNGAYTIYACGSV
jgi:hypothetical protein